MISDPPRGLLPTLRQIGPGIIISGAIVGSGELIVTTKLGAEVGITLLWLILFSCFIKVFVQIELGRYVVASGDTALEALQRLPGPRLQLGRLRLHWLLCLWAVMALGSVVQLAGILSGLIDITALPGSGLTGVPEIVALGLTVLVTAGLLSMGRYGLIEKTTTILVCLFCALTLTAAICVQSQPTQALAWSEAGRGLSFQLPPDHVLTALAMLGITGVGASELIFYPYWCLEKGYARRVGPQPNNHSDIPAWEQRARGWIRIMRIDAWCSFGIYTVSTVAFYWLGAAVLHRRGQVPTDADLHPVLSQIYTAGFGEQAGLWVYVLGAIAVLFSTFFVATASNGRVFADALQVFGLVDLRDAARKRLWIGGFCIAIPLFCWAIVAGIPEPVLLITIGAIAQSAMLPLLAFAAIYLRYRRVPKALAPRGWTDVFVWIGTAALLLVGGYQLAQLGGLA